MSVRVRVSVRVAALLPYERVQVDALLELPLAPSLSLALSLISARTCRSKPSLNLSVSVRG